LLNLDVFFGHVFWYYVEAVLHGGTVLILIFVLIAERAKSNQKLESKISDK
jgi:hypothetical protein